MTSESRKEKALRLFTFACAFGVVIVTGAVAYVLASQALPFFRQSSISEFLTGTRWRPTAAPAHFGVLPLLSGSLLITVGAAIIAVPAGVLAAIYLNEYAAPSSRALLKPPLEVLAGIPTVVYGYLGLFLVTPALRMLSDRFQASNAASAAIVVGIMILPMVASLTEDSLAAVPRSLREGAYALGLTKAEVTLGIVLPAARSGIAAAFVLALSRAVGETMAVTLAAGSTPNLTLDPTRGVATMSSYIISTAQGDAEVGSIRYTSAFAVGLLLFLVTFSANAVGVALLRRFQQRAHAR
jgi:phosphate transport system permease protein